VVCQRALSTLVRGHRPLERLFFPPAWEPPPTPSRLADALEAPLRRLAPHLDPVRPHHWWCLAIASPRVAGVAREGACLGQKPHQRAGWLIHNLLPSDPWMAQEVDFGEQRGASWS